MKVSPSDLPQQFTICHLDEADFKTGGLRDYSAYRDLGVAAATGGLAEAHVIRMTAPFRSELGVRHHYNVQFQMIYCLKGWFETDFEGIGPHRLSPDLAGCSHQRSDTRSSDGRQTASCWKS